ncbi:iron-containing alcohol dehydrogenase [Bacillus infantis]|uniref:iron-containing alcohol dehydrogenase n=1 Tax=Bacillus infantis TaxID=324767 RepID=UPI0020049567|nr:iron-containing alcohol dehydrogenase [Bacillus infantis]MCK6205251.1 iron-containing alcohol dehydrogenase [Bacillus infantis]
MVNLYQFYLPTKVFFGIHALDRIKEAIDSEDSSHVLIITDKGIVKAGLVDTLEKKLRELNVHYAIFDEVEPNPKSTTIARGLQASEENKTTLLIAIGGGSSIDTAKAVAVMSRNSGTILDYEGVGKVKNAPLPTIMIPTTAGTGSEVTASSIITDEHTLFKMAIISEKIFPTYAIVDPILTLGCPNFIISSTGIDALTHAIESYLSKQKNGIVSELALKAIRLINENISKSYFRGNDLESNTHMLEASMLAGMAFSQTRLGNVHAISQSFGGLFDIPHGFANAVLLPYVLEFNYKAAVDDFCEIAKAMDVFDNSKPKIENAYAVVERILLLNEELAIPKTTKELGVDLSKLDVLIRDSMRSGNILVNPRVTTKEDIETLIINSYEGKL